MSSHPIQLLATPDMAAEEALNTRISVYNSLSNSYMIPWIRGGKKVAYALHKKSYTDVVDELRGKDDLAMSSRVTETPNPRQKTARAGHRLTAADIRYTVPSRICITPNSYILYRLYCIRRP